MNKKHTSAASVLRALPKPVMQRLNGDDYVGEYTPDQIAIIAILVKIVVPVLLVACRMPQQAEIIHRLNVTRQNFKVVGERLRVVHGRLHTASAKHPEPWFQAALGGVGAVDHAATAAFEVEDHTREAMDEAFKAVDAAEHAGALSAQDAGDLREDLNNAQADLHHLGIDFSDKSA